MTAGLPVLVTWALTWALTCALTSTLTLATCMLAAAAETPQCGQALAKMRSESAKRASEMEIAIRDNATAARTCALSAAYLAADAKVLAFMKSNQQRCGIEALLVAQQQAVHDSNSRATDVLCKPHP